MKKQKQKVGKGIQWLIYVVLYVLIIILLNNLFDTIYIDPKHQFLTTFILLLLLTILNQTVRPILVRLTVPIIGVTLGIFYLLINLFILKLVDWMMGPFFNMTDFWPALLFSVLITIANLILEAVFRDVKKTTKKIKKNKKD